MTAAVAMTLVEEGRIGINEPVVAYVAELTGPGDDEVLVHHLLTHTAGWESAQRTHRIEQFVRSGEIAPPPPGRDFITHLFLSLALDPIRVAAPGDEMQYDNGPYELLAEIVRARPRHARCALVRGSSNRWAWSAAQASSATIFGRMSSLGQQAFRSARADRSSSRATSGSCRIREPPHGTHVGAGPRSIRTDDPERRCPRRQPRAGSVDGDVDGHQPDTRGSPPCSATRSSRSRAGGTDSRWCSHAGSRTSPGASYRWEVRCIRGGWRGYWVDFVNEIVGVFFEVITEVDEFLVPGLGIGHRFQDVITAAVNE